VKVLVADLSSSRQPRMSAFSASTGLCLRAAVVNWSVHSKAPPLVKIAK
jgi:hypothetical protein